VLDFVKKDDRFLPFIFISVEEAGGGEEERGGGRGVVWEVGGEREEAMNLNWHGGTIAIKEQLFVSVSMLYEDMSLWVLDKR